MTEFAKARKVNFNPGPSALPLEVLEEARDNLVVHRALGMSLLEAGHRTPFVEELFHSAERKLLELLELPPTGYRALFMGGGASSQFALVPMNLLTEDKTAVYTITGSFAEKAYAEAGRIGKTAIAGSTKAEGYRNVPKPEALIVPPDAAYVHYTVNNTIEGTQWRELPDFGATPLAADVSSCILGSRMDYAKLGIAYAGAQKNLGPAGVTAVIVNERLLATANERLPVIFRYATYAANNSLYNTPPVHSVYLMSLVLDWVKRQGGVAAMERVNEAKAKLLYDTIDGSGGFYEGNADREARSLMNVTWRMRDSETEQRFLGIAAAEGFEGLAGHRSVGGLRASIYNAVSLEACRALAGFMADFAARCG